MKITVRGDSKHLTRQQISRAAEFMMKLLVVDQQRLLDRIRLTIRLQQPLTGSKGLTECTTIDGDYWLQYIVSIRSTMSKKEQLTTLAHELVHVKQFATGQFCPLDYGNKRKWMHRMINCDNLDYWDYPWEVDAYGREPGLYHRYVQKFGTDS